jgi:integrase
MTIPGSVGFRPVPQRPAEVRLGSGLALAVARDGTVYVSYMIAAPTTVAAYLTAHVPPGFAVSTLRRRLAAISVMHQAAGHKAADLPTRAAEVRTVWAGIRRTHGVAPKKVRAARTKVIIALVAPLGTKPIDVRDRPLLLIGFAGALRRSELVGLDVGDMSEDEGGLRPGPGR